MLPAISKINLSRYVNPILTNNFFVWINSKPENNPFPPPGTNVLK